MSKEEYKPIMKTWVLDRNNISNKRPLHITYDEAGRAIRYERRITTNLFSTEVTFLAEYADGVWNINMILPPTGVNNIYVSLNGDPEDPSFDNDNYFNFNELSQLQREAVRFRDDIQDTFRLEISVNIETK